MRLRLALATCSVLLLALRVLAQTEIPVFNSIEYLQTGQTLAQLCSGFSGTVEVTIPTTVSASNVLPASCSIRIESGGSITISSGQYLQISGPFSAGLYQVFYGPGSVYFYGGATSSVEKVYPQWFGVMGNAKASGYTSTANNSTITVGNYTGSGNWQVGDPITLVNGNGTGVNDVTTVTGTPSNLTLTVASAPTSTVSTLSPAYSVDDSQALNAWSASLRGTINLGFLNGTTSGYDMRSALGPATLYVPKGQYNVCSAPVQIYRGEVLKFEASNTTHAAVFNQCNVATAAIVMNPNAYNPGGALVVNGTGNNTLNNVSVRGSYLMGTPQAPAIQFLPARNIVSDTRLNNLMFESIPGPGIMVGFQTTTSGTVNSSSTTIPLGSVTGLVASMLVEIAGAGPSGGTYSGTISSVGTNSIVVAPATATAVTNAAVTLGFQTITDGSVSSGSTTIPLVTGAALTNGMTIQIVGAGMAGGTYTGTISSGGGTNSVVVSPATSTGVTNAIVLAPGTDTYGLIINNPEIDGGSSYFVQAQGNAGGAIWVDNGEIYNPIYGAVYSNAGPMSLRWTNNKCFGCGQPNYTPDAFTHAIYVQDNTHSGTSDVEIEHSAFYPVPLAGGAANTWGGNIEVLYSRSFDIHNSQIWDVDSYSNYKGILLDGQSTVSMIGNTINMKTFSSSATNSYLISLFSGPAQMVMALNNLQNISANMLTYGIYFTGAPPSWITGLNNYAGVTAVSNNSGDGSIIPQYLGQFTTTATTADTITSSSSGISPAIANVQVGALCSASPLNSTAASMVSGGTYIQVVTTKGLLSFVHPSTAGGLFAISCGLN